MSQNLSAKQIHYGACARSDFRDGKNPPAWVTDEAAWGRAKEAASKTYNMDDDAFWPVVVSIYEKMSNAALPDTAESAASSTPTLPNSVPMEFLGNGVAVGDDGWALVPYGDWPHEAGVQKFHRMQAEELVETFHGMANRFKRALVGLPIFKGHPDHPDKAIANMHPDKADKGQVADMQVRENGLALKLVLSNAGADLVRKGWKFISPLWLCRLVSAAGDARRVFEPATLASVGLVTKPNIPCASLANSAQNAGNKTKRMKPETLKLLGLADNASDEEVHAKVEALANSAGALANEQSARTTAETKVTALENEKNTATTKLTEANTALANERKARVTEAIAHAIVTGRITKADEKVWGERLLANSAEFENLAKLPVKVKVASEALAALAESQAKLANAAGKGKSEPDGDEDEDGDEDHEFSNADLAAMPNGKRGALMRKLVANEMERCKGTPDAYNRAYAAVKKRNPALFGSQT